MIGHTLTSKADKLLRYCERYVNCESPSGYGVSNQLTENTNPFSDTSSFELKAVDASEFPKHEIFGEVPKLICKDEFFVHPMMLTSAQQSWPTSHVGAVRVYPTSSGRTVKVASHPNCYIKLHFDGTLGRVNRSLTYAKAVAGVEVGSILEKGVDNKVLNQNVGIFREIGTKIVWHEKDKSSAYILRDGRIWFQDSKPVNFVVPFFSMFSVDKKPTKTCYSVYVDSVLREIRQRTVEDYRNFFAVIIKAAIDLYWEALLNLGLQIEFNAQNVLVAFDENLNPVGIVLRDFSGIEKDSGFSSDYWPSRFLSYPYKCINPEDDDYRIRRSFSYDFKLGTYIVQPIVQSVIGEFPTVGQEWLQQSRAISHAWLDKVAGDFLPEGLWYSHPKQLLTKTRPYQTNENPILR